MDYEVKALLHGATVVHAQLCQVLAFCSIAKPTFVCICTHLLHLIKRLPAASKVALAFDASTDSYQCG